jgi:hypothetical protein
MTIGTQAIHHRRHRGHGENMKESKTDQMVFHYLLCACGVCGGEIFRLNLIGFDLARYIDPHS